MASSSGEYDSMSVLTVGSTSMLTVGSTSMLTVGSTSMLTVGSTSMFREPSRAKNSVLATNEQYPNNILHSAHTLGVLYYVIKKFGPGYERTIPE